VRNCLSTLGLRLRRLRDRFGLSMRIEDANDESSDARDRPPRGISDAPDLRTRVNRAIGCEGTHAA